MKVFDLQELFFGSTLDMLRNIACSEHGLVVVTGQAASGKATTMFSLALEASRTGREVHVVVPGNERADARPGGFRAGAPDDWHWSFLDSEADRDALRAAIDDAVGKGRVIVFCGSGEETIRAAAGLSLENEFVLAQIDTPLIGLDVAYTLSGFGLTNAESVRSLVGIVSQMLLPRLCERCRAVVHAEVLETRLIHPHATDSRELWIEQGCDDCGQSGTKGLIPATEVLSITDEIRDSIEQFLDTGEFIPLPVTVHQKMIQSIREQAKLGRIGLRSYKSAASRNPLLRGHHLIEAEQLRSSRIRDRLNRVIGELPEGPSPLVFVSHASANRNLIEDRIIPALERAACRAWYSKVSIRSATEWERSILAGLHQCDWFLLVLTPDVLASEWVKDEFFWAMDHRPDHIIPVLLEACDPGDFHIRLRRLQIIDLSAANADDMLVESLLDRRQGRV